ncbi:helix-turn-helix domain-containing protein [Streptomyces clavuligerus]|uniref:helix-turn-helix domain-containing protein n=1 Tax=Streptomyces clavuligerus TaxID=1901 RepID=UPI001F07ECD0|nr:LysR family transcriptional regulator [Streptomyces clavuligerus]
MAEEGSFTKAAARCHVVQPAISQQIQAPRGRSWASRSPNGCPGRSRLTSGWYRPAAHARALSAAAAAGRPGVRDRSGLPQRLCSRWGPSRTGWDPCPPAASGSTTAGYAPASRPSHRGVEPRPVGAGPQRDARRLAIVAAPPEGLPAHIGSRLLLEDRIIAVVPSAPGPRTAVDARPGRPAPPSSATAPTAGRTAFIRRRLRRAGAAAGHRVRDPTMSPSRWRWSPNASASR